MEYAIIILLILLHGVREYMSYKERQELMDRAMSGNLREYKEVSTPETNKLEEEDDGLVSVEEAKNAILENEEE